MKNIISLIDTNVIINFITKRDDPYKDACFDVMKLCAENVFKGYVAFHYLVCDQKAGDRRKSKGLA